MNHVSDQLAQLYLDYLAKKHKGLKLKPFQVQRHCFVCFASLRLGVWHDARIMLEGSV